MIDWRDLLGGEPTSDLRSAAVFDVTVIDGEPGDARAVAFAWPAEGAAEVADNDIFGGSEGSIISQVLEEIAASGWELTGLGEVWAAGDVPGIGEVVADAAPMRLRHAFGPDAGGIPSAGWIATAHQDGGNIDRPWWIILDDHGTPRRVFATAGRPRAN